MGEAPKEIADVREGIEGILVFTPKALRSHSLGLPERSEGYPRKAIQMIFNPEGVASSVR
jgi:hypothetical protein